MARFEVVSFADESQEFVDAPPISPVPTYGVRPGAYRPWDSTEQQRRFLTFVREREPTELHGEGRWWLHGLLANIETHGRVPQPRSAGRIADLLGIEVGEVMALLPARSEQDHGLAWAAYRRALARSGLTHGEVAQAVGLSPDTIQDWLDGRKTAFLDNVRRVAELLDAPELVATLRMRPRRVRMRCRECGAEKDYQPHALNVLIQVRDDWLAGARAKGRVAELPRTLPPIALEGDGSHGVYTCAHCAWSINGTEYVRRIKRRDGADAFYWLGLKAAEKRWKRADGAHRQRIGQALAEGNRTRERTSEESARRRLALMRLELEGRFSLCVKCEKLIFTTADADRLAIHRDTRAGLFHVACLREWRGDPRMRSWLGQGHARRRKGLTESPMPLPVRTEGRKATPAELLDMYRAAVLLLWQQEGVGQARRDDYGKPVPISELARQVDLSRSTLYERASRFVGLLPAEAVAAGRIGRWREVLLTLWRPGPRAAAMT